jgi:anti-sigma factor RsiW
MGCDRIEYIHRYHDGELSPADREAAEAHIQDCADCRRALAELQSLSSLITAAPLAGMPSGVAVRYDQCRRAARERGVLRLAGWLTAAAAGVLIGALLNSYPAGPEAVPPPGVWQTMAVMSPAEVQDSDGVVAEWMADDLSLSEPW